MSSDWSACPPHPQESLKDYVCRLRQQQNWTQAQLATAAGVHRQTIGKIEKGQTQRLNQRARNGLAFALSIPAEYLDALSQGQPVTPVSSVKFCPQCWRPGQTPDPMWTDLRSHFCFACGTRLISQCAQCQQPILSLQFRFCPYCGKAYQSKAASST